MSGSSNVQHVTVSAEDEGVRLDRWFKRHIPGLGHGQLEKLLRTGQIRVDGGRAKAGDRLAEGQTLRLPPDALSVPERRAKAPAALSEDDRRLIQEMILAETATFVALSKPPGLAVQGGSGTRRHLDGLLTAFSAERGERWRLVHRLDRDTSGVLLVAKTPAAASHLALSFKTRDTEKIYWALTAGVPKPHQGRIDLALAKRADLARQGRETMEAADEEDTEAKRAVTDFMVLGDAKKIAFIAARPVTGRTHQIRAHLAAIGAPILGDFKYGGERAAPGGAIPPGLMLHARSLAFVDPEGRKRFIEAPPPKPFAEAMALFGFDRPNKALPFPPI